MRETQPKPAPPPTEPPPPDAWEIAESDRIAAAHWLVFCRAMRAHGLSPFAPRRRASPAAIRTGRDKIQPADPGKRSFDRALADFLQTVSRTCSRPECRRAFQCRYGVRRGETPSDLNPYARTPNCLTRLPRAALVAAELILRRKQAPELFRDQRERETEAKLLRVVQSDLEALRAARMDAAAGGDRLSPGVSTQGGSGFSGPTLSGSGRDQHSGKLTARPPSEVSL